MRPEPLRLHITGASGSGTTTLGRALAERYSLTSLDSDDFYWRQTPVPYSEKRPVQNRRTLLARAMGAAEDRWVLSGSCMIWGNPFRRDFDLCIYLYVPQEERLRRLKEREARELGDAILPGGASHDEHVEFLEWAAAYDSAGYEQRSAKSHAAWLRTLRCGVLRIEGVVPLEESLARVAAALPLAA